MAKSTHDKQLERARSKRQQDVLARRRGRSRVMVIVVIALLVLSLVAVALVGTLGGDDGAPVIEDDPSAAADGGAADLDAPDGGADAAAGDQEPCPPAPDDVPEVDSDLYDDVPEQTIDPDATYTATIATTCGDIVVELAAAEAPIAVNNFVFLAEEGYYDGVGFHRVIDGFVAQAGDPAGTGCGREDCGTVGDGAEAFPGYSFEDELDHAEAVVADEGGYPQGALAMANAGTDTNGSQWFIVEPEEGVALPPSYTLFGQVTEGQDVVESIVLGPVEGDAPIDPVIITSVTIETS